MSEPRAPTAPASLHARDRICEWPAAHTAGGAEYYRPRLGSRTGADRGRGCGHRERVARGEGVVKRCGPPCEKTHS